MCSDEWFKYNVNTNPLEQETGTGNLDNKIHWEKYFRVIR